jgi:hypothetical protein
MVDSPGPDTPEDRIARAAARVTAAMARTSDAREILTVASERLAVARRALEHAQAHDAQERAAENDPTKPGETP